MLVTSVLRRSGASITAAQLRVDSLFDGMRCALLLVSRRCSRSCRRRAARAGDARPVGDRQRLRHRGAPERRSASAARCPALQRSTRAADALPRPVPRPPTAAGARSPRRRLGLAARSARGAAARRVGLELRRSRRRGGRRHRLRGVVSFQWRRAGTRRPARAADHRGAATARTAGADPAGFSAAHLRDRLALSRREQPRVVRDHAGDAERLERAGSAPASSTVHT